MAEFNTGMSKVRQLVRTLEQVSDFMKYLVQNGRDAAHFKAFTSELHQADPKHPTINEENCTFYDVTGVGPEKMQDLFDRCKIPSAAFLDQKTDTTVVAVPIQYERQANILLAKHEELTVSMGARVKSDPGVLQKMTANMMQTPSPMVLASMQGGNAVTKVFDSARYMPLIREMEKAAIPFALVHNRQDNTVAVVFDQKFAVPVDRMDRAIEKAKAPAELSYADFMKANMGQEIIEHKGMSEGQVREVREGLRGSSLGYNVQKQQNGTYTIRYAAQHAQLATPIITGAVVRSNGVNDRGEPIRPGMDAHAHYVSTQAEQACNLAMQQQNMMIVDAMDTQKFYKVTEKGLFGPDGKMIASKDDKHFAETVHSVTSRMKAPVVKQAGEDGKLDMGIFSKQEIAEAKASHAGAVPTDASIMAAQIATMRVTTGLAQPNADVANVINDTAAFLNKTANSIEEESFRLSPEEWNNDVSYANSEKPEVVTEFEDTVHNMSNDSVSPLSTGLRSASKETSAVFSTRKVEAQDLSIDEMGRHLEGREDMDLGDGEPTLGGTPMDRDDDGVLDVLEGV